MCVSMRSLPLIHSPETWESFVSLVMLLATFCACSLLDAFHEALSRVVIKINGNCRCVSG